MNRLASKACAAAIACAAAAGVQAQTTAPVLYGLLDMGAGQFQVPGGPHRRVALNGGMSPSFIGLRGSDDLGGGLRARFGLESYVGLNAGVAGRTPADSFWSRTAYVGLQGAFGSSLLGRLPTPLWTSTRLFNPFGDSTAFSPSVRQYFGGPVVGDSRWNNSVLFTSPEPENGNGLTYSVQFNASGGQLGTGKNVGANFVYVSGPLAATVAWQRVANSPAALPAGFDHQSTYQFGASYELAAVKIYGQAGMVRTNAAVRDKTSLYQLGAVAPVGLGFIIGSYGHSRAESLGTSQIRRTVSVGYDYFLSKNTDIYAVMMNEQLTNLSSGNSIGAGLRLRF
jgi:predicted porin